MACEDPLRLDNEILNFKAHMPGASLAFPAMFAPVGVATGVVHTKCEVSIWILSLHLAPISRKASFAFSNNTGSWTLPKHTDMPEVSDMMCAYTKEVRREGACCCAEDELEGVFGVDSHARVLCRCVGHW